MSPFFEGEGFGAAHGVEVGGLEEGVYFFFGPPQAAEEGVADGFAFLAVSGFGEAEEGVEVGGGDAGFGVEVDADNGGVHLRGGVKRAGGDVGDDGGLTIDLDAEGEEAHLRVGFVRAVGGGADTFGDFALDGEDDPGGRVAAFEQVADDGGGDVVGDVGDDEVGGEWVIG